MPASPVEVVGRWLQSLLDPDVVSSVVAADATHVSLNTEDPSSSWTVQAEPGAEPFKV